MSDKATERGPGRAGWLLLAVLLGWFLAWDLRAVLTDQRPALISSDTTVCDLVRLETALNQDEFLRWAAEPYVKGPLGALLAYPIKLAVGDALLACRLLGVAAHTTLLLLLALLARRVGAGRWDLALLAVLISGVSPMQYGWFRMDFHDSLTALAVTGTLLALAGDLTRRTSGLWLGLAGGFGMLSKLSYPIFIIGPGLLALAVRVRGRRALISLAVALLLAAGLASLWLVPSWVEIMNNLTDSTHSGHPWLYKLHVYFVRLPGSALLTAAGLVGAALAFRFRVVPAGALLSLLLVPVVGVLLLIAIFDLWPRYLLPALPPLGLLAAAGLCAIGDRLPGRKARAVAGGVLVLALLVQYVVLNFTGIEDRFDHEPREFFAGMVAPDQREYGGYHKAAAYLEERGWLLLEFSSGPNAVAYPVSWWNAGIPREVFNWSDLKPRMESGAVGALILLHDEEGVDAALRRYLYLPSHWAADKEGSNPRQIFEERNPREALSPELIGLFDFVGGLRRTLAVTYTDPDGVKYSVIKLERR